MMNVSDSTLTNNQAAGGEHSDASGGAIFNSAATLILSDSALVAGCHRHSGPAE